MSIETGPYLESLLNLLLKNSQNGVKSRGNVSLTRKQPKTSTKKPAKWKRNHYWVWDPSIMITAGLINNWYNVAKSKLHFNNSSYKYVHNKTQSREGTVRERRIANKLLEEMFNQFFVWFARTWSSEGCERWCKFLCSTFEIVLFLKE